FAALRKFLVWRIRSWKSFVAAARDMKRLEDITFSIEKNELRTKEVTSGSFLIPRLRALNVTIYGCRKPPFLDTIYYVYEALAVSSKSLDTLRIKIEYSDRIHQYEGGKLVRKIARDHGPTIRSLLIDDM
ncbi:14544_t:CDS:2, partial [Acaulospora colombiana]